MEKGNDYPSNGKRADPLFLQGRNPRETRKKKKSTQREKGVLKPSGRTINVKKKRMQSAGTRRNSPVARNGGSANGVSRTHTPRDLMKKEEHLSSTSGEKKGSRTR